MNLIDISTNSPHYFYWKQIGTTSLTFHPVSCLCLPLPFNHMNKSYWASPHEVFTLAVMQSKITLQTIEYRKSRIWEIKEDKYAKGLGKNQVCAIFSYARCSEKRFTQIYKALYGDAMFVSLSGAQIWPPETNRNICFWVFLLMREFIAWKTHKGLKWYLFWDKECLDSKISQNW